MGKPQVNRRFRANAGVIRTTLHELRIRRLGLELGEFAESPPGVLRTTTARRLSGGVVDGEPVGSRL
jgi:hypothetical protein